MHSVVRIGSRSIVVSIKAAVSQRLLLSVVGVFVLPVAINCHPRTPRSEFGCRTFSVSGPTAWNSLPDLSVPTRSSDTFTTTIKHTYSQLSETLRVMELFTRSVPDLDSSAHDRIWRILCSHFASHSRFVTVFSVCNVSLQSFDITPPKSFLSIIIIIWYTCVCCLPCLCVCVLLCLSVLSCICYFIVCTFVQCAI